MSVKGQWWKVQISDSALATVHGFSRWITELNIPSIGISVNIVDNKTNCFQTYPGRYGKENATKCGKTVNVPGNLVSAAQAYLATKDGFDKEVKKWFSQNEPRTPDPKPTSPKKQPVTVTRSGNSSTLFWAPSK